MRRVFAALALLALAGCGPLVMEGDKPSAQPIAYGPTTERQVEKALQRYSALMLAMDAEGVSQMYAPDGVWERQSGPVIGRSAIRSALSNTGGARVLANEMTMANMSYNGPAVVQVGDFKQSVRLPDGKVVNANGRFEATWVRSDDGQWWIRRMVVQPAK